MKNKIEKLAFSFLLIYFISEALNVFRVIWPLQGFLSILYTLGNYSIYFALICVILCSLITRSKKSTLIFFTLAFLFGFVSEFLGTTYGWIFGSYYYKETMRSLLGLMSIETPISWAVIIFLSFELASLIIGFWPKASESIQKSGRYFLILILFSVISGFIAMNLDMIIDPIAVLTGAWTWVGGGPYFEIPISNFIGWFAVTCIFTLVFMAFSLSIVKETFSKKSISVGFIVISIYSIYLFRHAALAINSGHEEFALIGISTMMPIILIALIKLINGNSKFCCQ